MQYRFWGDPANVAGAVASHRRKCTIITDADKQLCTRSDQLRWVRLMDKRSQQIIAVGLVRRWVYN